MKKDDYRNWLWPPDSLLEQIEVDSSWFMFTIPILAERPTMEVTSATIEGVRSFAQEYFRRVLDLELKEWHAYLKSGTWFEFTHNFLLSLSELVKNVYEHGNKGMENSIAHLGIWFGKKGIIIGIRDEGDFYTLDSTRVAFEERQAIPSTKEDPSGHGTEIFCEHADYPVVRQDQNALFLGFKLKKNEL